MAEPISFRWRAPGPRRILAGGLALRPYVGARRSVGGSGSAGWRTGWSEGRGCKRIASLSFGTRSDARGFLSMMGVTPLVAANRCSS